MTESTKNERSVCAMAEELRQFVDKYVFLNYACSVFFQQICIIFIKFNLSYQGKRSYLRY